MDSRLYICSYNKGSDIRDFNLAYSFIYPGSKSSDTDYQAAEEKSATLLNNRAHVFCLQEFEKYISNPKGGPPIATSEHSLTQTLMEKKFKFIQFRRKEETDSMDVPTATDAVVALDSTRFDDINNYSTNRWVAIAIATDKVTKQRIAFVSIHVAGFTLTESREQMQKDFNAFSGPYPGDRECDELIQKLNELKDLVDIQIIGGDMNASPEKWENRFSKFNEHQFQIVRSNKPTALNSSDQTYQEREIDYFFFRKKSLGKIASLFKSSLQVQINEIDGFDPWNIKNNASDHRPIGLIVNVK